MQDFVALVRQSKICISSRFFSVSFSHAHLPVSLLHSLLLTRVCVCVSSCLLCCVLIDFHSVSVDSFCVWLINAVVFFWSWLENYELNDCRLELGWIHSQCDLEKKPELTQKTWSFENIKFFCTHRWHDYIIVDVVAQYNLFLHTDYCALPYGSRLLLAIFG